MIRYRRATVLGVRRPHAGLVECEIDLDGRPALALAYEDLTGAPRAGDGVLVNTTALDLGLGTGGVHLVVAIDGGAPDIGDGGHAMKLRYTPVQVAVDAVEEIHRDAISSVTSLDGMPVVVAGLHSALAPVAIGIEAVAPRARVAYVMTDGGALPIAFSRAVPALRAAGLIDTTITAGHAFGGELEAVTVFGALAAAKAVARADVTVVAMGPGNLGTGSRWGFASIETAAIVNAVAALGGRPLVVPRISFSDPRERHRGVSHHTITALGVTLARAEIACATLDTDRSELVRKQLADGGALERHELVEVDLGPAEEALRDPPVTLSTMGRGYDDDPEPFRAAAAAGVLAARAV